MGELFRVLRPGGKILATFNNFSFKGGLDNLSGTILPIVIGGRVHADVLARKQNEYIEALKKAGFTLETVENFDSSSAEVNPAFPNAKDVVFENTIVVGSK